MRYPIVWWFVRERKTGGPLAGLQHCACRWLPTDASAERIALGFLVLFAASVSVVFWLQIARDVQCKYDALLLSSAGVFVALWLLCTSIAEWRPWRRLHRGQLGV